MLCKPMQFLILSTESKPMTMRNSMFFICALFFLPFSALAQEDEQVCNNLKQVVDAAQEYFKELRGEDTSIEIRGVPKPYQQSTVTIYDGEEMLITADEYYPEAVTYLARNRFYSDELEAEYQKLKDLMVDCLGEDWVTVEKDKNNDIFLEDTDYKKFIVSENKKGKKVKLELYMYNQRELNTWVVELKVFGVGRKI